MVESNLISDTNPYEPKPLALEISIPFFDKLKIIKCKHCNTSFSRYDPLLHYEHSSGWIVPGFEKKQWLILECPECKFQFSLWKLGVSKDVEVKPVIPFEHLNDDPDYDPLIGSKMDLEQQVQDHNIAKDLLQEDLESVCKEKVKLQFKLCMVRKTISDRLNELAKYDPYWKVDNIPEEMEKRTPEINNLNEIIEIIDKVEDEH